MRKSREKKETPQKLKVKVKVEFEQGTLIVIIICEEGRIKIQKNSLNNRTIEREREREGLTNEVGNKQVHILSHDQRERKRKRTKNKEQRKMKKKMKKKKKKKKNYEEASRKKQEGRRRRTKGKRQRKEGRKGRGKKKKKVQTRKFFFSFFFECSLSGELDRKKESIGRIRRSSKRSLLFLFREKNSSWTVGFLVRMTFKLNSCKQTGTNWFSEQARAITSRKQESQSEEIDSSEHERERHRLRPDKRLEVGCEGG